MQLIALLPTEFFKCTWCVAFLQFLDVQTQSTTTRLTLGLILYIVEVVQLTQNPLCCLLVHTTQTLYNTLLSLGGNVLSQ